MSEPSLVTADIAAFKDTRTQLHWAAQIVAGMGLTHAPAVPDWSHAALRYDPLHEALVSALGPAKLRTGLLLRQGAVCTLRSANGPSNMLALEGATFAEVHAHLNEHTGGRIDHRSTDSMPPHEVNKGAPFAPDPSALATLADWFAAADVGLTHATLDLPGTGGRFVWPHHFDLATLVTIRPAARDDQEDVVSVGLGMTPGDEGTDEPYFYAAPWPYPRAEDLPALQGPGQWTHDNWTGAILRMSALPRENQRTTIGLFYDAAFNALATTLERAPM